MKLNGEDAADLMQYIDDAKRELGDRHIIGQPLPEAIKSLVEDLAAAEARLDGRVGDDEPTGGNDGDTQAQNQA